MLAELGLSRSLFSVAYAVGTLASAGVLLLVGREIDRWGTRLVMVAAGVAFAVSLLFMSAVGNFIALLVGFSLLRSSGQGVLNLAARTLIPHWFVRRRGRAFSLLGLASMLSLAVVPSANEALITRSGWRTAWQVEAAAIALVLVPAVASGSGTGRRRSGNCPTGSVSAPTTPSPMRSAACHFARRWAPRHSGDGRRRSRALAGRHRPGLQPGRHPHRPRPAGRAGGGDVHRRVSRGPAQTALWPGGCRTASRPATSWPPASSSWRWR